MPIINESLSYVNALRAQAGLGPIEGTLGGAEQAAQITANYNNPPAGTISSAQSPAPQVIAPAAPSTQSAAMLSQSTLPPIAQGSDLVGTVTAQTTSNVPYVEQLTTLLKQHGIGLTATQKKALEIGVGVASAAAGAYAAYRLTRKKKSSRSTTRRRYTARRRSVRRGKAHLVKGSLAAKRHMSRLRKMRKR